MKQDLLLKSIFIISALTLFQFDIVKNQPYNDKKIYDEFLDMHRNIHQLIPISNFINNNADNLDLRANHNQKRLSHNITDHNSKHPDDIYWDDRFTFPGINGIVHAIAVSPNGDVYVGGNFTLAGKTPVNNIARWDGEKWHDLDGGVSQGTAPWATVRAIACMGNDVYVGGDFLRVGNNIEASFIARWDGQNWHPLGDSLDNGTTDQVYSLAVYNDKLYVGGMFWKVGGYGGIFANFIAKWDGQAWSTLGSVTQNGTDGPVWSLFTDDSLLYAGGSFTHAGGNYTNHIASWNGTNWFSLGTGLNNGVNGRVDAISSANGILYLGGAFTNAGTKTANYVVRWNGSEWLPLGDEISNGVNYRVYALAPDEQERMYVGGAFSATSADSASRIALWDRESWVPLENGLGGGIWIYPAIVFALTKGSNGVFAGGSFTTAGEKSANCIVKRINESWEPLLDGPGMGVNGKVITTAAGSNGEIYIGGGFTAVGDIADNYIAMWDGKQWHSLGSGIKKRYANIDPVSVIKIDDSGNVYVGGTFVSAGDVPANNIAMWDGTAWHSIGQGINNGLDESVYAIAFGNNGEVYVGGEFTMAGNIPVNYVAAWDGSNWYSLGTGSTNGVDDRVFAIDVNDMGEVYVGGAFYTAGGDTVNKIAKWDGNNWHNLGGGVTGNLPGAGVSDISIFNNNIFIAGAFDKADTVVANNIARWDGTRWYSLGTGNNNGLNDAVFAIEADRNGNLYAGGYFSKAGGDSANLVAKWDSTHWSGLGSGIGGFWLQINYGVVFDICIHNNDIYFGGAFSEAGNKTSHSFAHWNKPLTYIQNSPIEIHNFHLSQNYPNPFNSNTKISYFVPYPQNIELEIFDVTGRLVKTLVKKYQPAGEYSINFYSKDLTSGIYFYRLSGDRFSETKKMLLVR